MAVDFKMSETKENLMRAFAGESQARNRYTIAAEEAKKQKQHAVAEVFLYTADQERAHAEVFYRHLKELNGENIEICGAYPVELTNNLAELLRKAQHNEYEEHDDVYQKFGEKAKEEGFDMVAASFFMIAGIEKIHGDRFGKFADWMEQNKLHISDVKTGWMCLNCGFIYEGEQVPDQCPVCDSDKGYFIRLTLSPYED